ncbi:YbdK family carboxylate-amine ligase [Streptomyces inhibens]|uniref:Putative glutamate--cysteine ligase 2 n=1 Tax=Streptomyces inhibens TaxID=2293571 RepID=A0A371PWU1_STRIH|nr:glutamate--cysteine ligase [Streptomyces inhibens]REK86927.1 YbdK family carboxylate-amine ligase [Streptomyces inhibens]
MTSGPWPGPGPAGHPAAPSLGVEEEFFLVDPGSRAVASLGSQVVARARAAVGDLVSGEFDECQVEVKTPPCRDGAELYDQLIAVRGAAVAAARAEGLGICASGTPVILGEGPAVVGDHPRYRAGLDQFGALLDGFAICAAHVHVHVPDRELAVLVGNHLRPWLPLLVAMSANSPFLDGRDMGYASWRTVIRARFPALGAPPYVESLDHYERLTAALEETEAMLDARIPFWDVRPNPRLPTLEIRVMDVSVDVADTVALAVLIRALVVTAGALVHRGCPGPQTCGELVHAAYWRAARDGWPGKGVDALTGRILPCSVQAARLVEHVRPALEEYGDLDLAVGFLRRLAERGSGAQRQRSWSRPRTPGAAPSAP